MHTQHAPSQAGQNHAPRYAAPRTRRTRSPHMESAYFDRWILDSDWDSAPVTVDVNFPGDDA